jgi:hypothetical protein
MRRDINNIDYDLSCKKRIIEQMLYEDPDIIEVIDNPNIDPTCPDEILYTNIFPFIRVPDTQDVATSYITFTIDDMEQGLRNDAMKRQHVQFIIFVHKDKVKTKWGIPRHDLLGYLIQDIFNLSNKLGLQANFQSSREGYTDTDYCTRTLQFEMTTPNSARAFRTNQYEQKSIVNRHDSVLQREQVGEFHGQ